MLSRRRFLANSAAAGFSISARRLFAQSVLESTLVNTPLGTLRGETSNGVRIFRGVPFAQPPVGDLRFRPPLPAKPWAGERDATRFSAAPMQWNESAAPGQPAVAYSEDCLYLNIWAPETKRPYPVFVWIHGGSFIKGYAFEPIFDGSVFADVGIVCVNIAYRLGVLGFLDLGPVLGPEYHGSANNALRDLILALEWIQANIHAFGGDPSHVTIGGESGGAKLTGTLMGIPSAEPLFHQMISESGGAERNFSLADSAAVSHAFAEQWRTQTGKDISAVKSSPAEQLIEVQHKFLGEYSRNHPLRPEIDGKLIPQLPVKTIAAGSTKGKRLLIGTNRDEMAYFVGPHPPQPASKDLGNLPLQTFNRVFARYDETFPEMNDYQRRIRALSAEEYWIPSVRLADAQLQGGGDAWVYLLCFVESSGPLAGYAYHTLDLALVWDRPHPDPANTVAEAALAKQVHLAWAAFIRGESPSAPGLPQWPPYSIETRPTMLLDNQSRVVHNPQEAELKLWDGVL
ncbi:MAG: carboxylesterase/lipase family protein [Silvibacterium sp.]|nr:carboxylesterase/lipase family protein [Silvibacterium sp.]